MRLDGISKRYGKTLALNDVSLSMAPGRCLAIVGENGAGKSTLVKVIGGMTHPSEGRVLIGGRPVNFRSPRDAQRSGIAVIPQELAYVPQMTVAENLLVGRWPHLLGVTSHRRIRELAARELDQLGLKQLGIEFDLDKRMDEVTLAERQLVEISKALSCDARLVILDEPTASLNDVESHKLLERLEAFKSAGVGVVYISHRLAECFRLADEIAVLRNGQVVAVVSPEATRPGEIVSLMLGTEYEEPPVPTSERASTEGAVLGVRDWRSDAVPRLRGVSFEVQAGEILGIFGLFGSGAEAIARGLAGHGSRIRGELHIDGKVRPPFRRPEQARRASIAYVPAERKIDGLALGRSIADNMNMLILHSLSRFGVIRERRQREEARRRAASFDVRLADVMQPVGDLSGGNQQKVLLASRLAFGPKVVVLHEPTRGVDVGARAQIHRILRETAAAGTAMVLVTSDLAEAVALSDRLLIVREGHVAAELSGPQIAETVALRVASAAVAS